MDFPERPNPMRCITVLLLATTAFAQDHLEEALVKAGKNRAELEKVLAHFKDPEKLAAAKFLIENMPGHGYVITRLVAADGTTIPYDPLDYPNFKAALARLDELEKKHGTIDFKRDGFRADVETMTADYLIRHIDNAFVVWKRSVPCTSTIVRPPFVLFRSRSVSRGTMTW